VKPISILSLWLGLTACGTSAESLRQDVDPNFLLPAETRRFSIEYVGKVTNIPPNTKTLRLWFPVPLDSSVQKISELKFSEPPQLTAEPKYGNRIAFWEIPNPSPDLTRTMSFICERKEIKMDLAQLSRDASDPANAFAVFRKPDQLVIVDAEIKFLSAAITTG
jgi:hypothetical protein